jgi:uncharacterized membrane protein
MAKDLGEAIGHAVGRVAREAVDNVSANARKASKSPLAGPKGLAAGAGLVALAPVAAKGASKLVRNQMADGANPIKKARDVVGGGVKDAVGKKIEDVGGAGGVVKQAGKSMLPGGGDGGDGDKPEGSEAIGKSRRMPIQQAVDVAVPIQTAYNQWTQFEDWPNFMHRLDRATQDDETHVSFKTKIWGISKEFTAEIVEQRPDERIRWRVTEGVNHTGVVTFHRLSDRLTRIDVDVQVEPGSLVEKAGRGMRHVKRAIRADLARFKAYIELEEDESGAWRGAIEDGDVKSKRESSGGGRSSGRSASSGGRSRSRSSSGGRSASSRGSSSGSRSAAASSGGSSSRAAGDSSSGSRSNGGSKKSRSSSGKSASKSSGGSSPKSSGGSSSSRSGGSSNGSSRSSSRGRQKAGAR